MKITKEMLSSWPVSADMHHWYLDYFPDGGDYRQIYAALIQTGHDEWADSLFEYACCLWSEQREFIDQEITSSQNIINTMQQHNSSLLFASTDSPPTNSTSYLFNRQPCVQLSCVTDYTQISSEGYCSKIANSGMNNLIASSANYSWISNAGYAGRIASSGEASRICNAGQNSRITSTGQRARISNSGNASKIISSGIGTRIANAAMRSRISTVSDRVKIANAGDLSKISSFGQDAIIANSSNDVAIVAMGDNSVVVSAGSTTYVILGKGGCACMTYHDGQRVRFVTAYEGENGIEAGVKYQLDSQHNLVKLHDEKILA